MAADMDNFEGAVKSNSEESVAEFEYHQKGVVGFVHENLHKYPFLVPLIVMIVAVAASTAFLTPIGTTTNILVFSPGGYQFTDYVKVGLPLMLLSTYSRSEHAPSHKSQSTCAGFSCRISLPLA